MKRNNIFMWAYITFMALCCIVRCITDFSMWAPIVISISISSMFFAIEDLFSSTSEMYARLNKIRERSVSDFKDKLKQDKEAESRIEQAYKENYEIVPELRDCLPDFDYLKSCNEEIESIIKSIEKDNEKGKKVRTIYHWLAMAFSYLGFLLLFASMILISFIRVPTIVQELITVVSFAIILATSQINNIATEKIKEAEDVTVQVLKTYDAAVMSTKEMETKVYRVIATVKAQKENEIQEDGDNAN